MEQERLDYGDFDRPKKRPVFSPVQKVVIAVFVALALAMLLPELYWWLWPHIRP
jgi:hypothetical protein